MTSGPTREAMEIGAIRPAGRRSFSLRWSLRSMFLLMTALALWLGWYCNRAQLQRRAVASIEEQGGRIIYSHQLPLIQLGTPGLKAEAPWLAQYLGIDYADTVGIVEMIGDKFDDDDLKLLDSLPGVEMIRLHGTAITGRSFDSVSRHKRLHWLVVKDSPLEGGALQHLARLPGLKTLYLEGTEVGDEDLWHLVSLSRLEDLSLNETRVGDRGMSFISQLTSLKELHLERTRITDRGVVELAPLKRLQRITLYGTNITDKSVSVLLSLPAVKDAPVGQTNITSAGQRRLSVHLSGQPTVAQGIGTKE